MICIQILLFICRFGITLGISKYVHKYLLCEKMYQMQCTMRSALSVILIGDKNHTMVCNCETAVVWVSRSFGTRTIHRAILRGVSGGFWIWLHSTLQSPSHFRKSIGGEMSTPEVTPYQGSDAHIEFEPNQRETATRRGTKIVLAVVASWLLLHMFAQYLYILRRAWVTIHF